MQLIAIYPYIKELKDDQLGMRPGQAPFQARVGVNLELGLSKD